MSTEPSTPNNISPLALVETENIGHSVTIHPFAVIRPDVTLGNHAIIHPHVVIESGSVIGDHVEIFPGAHIGKTPRSSGATTTIPQYTPRLVIHNGCVIGSHAVIYYEVTIGKNTLVGDGASIRERVEIGEFCIISRYVTINYNVKIGSRTKIMDLSHITGNCTIGEDTFISTGVSSSNDNNLGRAGYTEENIQGPKIGNHVRIGAGANLLPKVIVQDDTLIGASALVTKDVLAGRTVYGVPARDSTR